MHVEYQNTGTTNIGNEKLNKLVEESLKGIYYHSLSNLQLRHDLPSGDELDHILSWLRLEAGNSLI